MNRTSCGERSGPLGPPAARRPQDLAGRSTCRACSGSRRPLALGGDRRNRKAQQLAHRRLLRVVQRDLETIRRTCAEVQAARAHSAAGSSLTFRVLRDTVTAFDVVMSGHNSAGRVSASQAESRGFESRCPLQLHGVRMAPFGKELPSQPPTCKPRRRRHGDRPGHPLRSARSRAAAARSGSRAACRARSSSGRRSRSPRARPSRPRSRHVGAHRRHRDRQHHGHRAGRAARERRASRATSRTPALHVVEGAKLEGRVHMRDRSPRPPRPGRPAPSPEAQLNHVFRHLRSR